MIRQLIKKYSEQFLFNTICVNFGLTQILQLDNDDGLKFQIDLFNEHILSKINLLIKQCKYVIIENEYTESVWKEIFSLHYAHTSYSSSNKVMRVHFFNSDIEHFSPENIKILDNSYLGYITLRPVPDFNLMLSFIMPNWNVLKFNNEDYIMTCEQIVHISSYAITIKTFPFYSQDTVVTTCAQADIIMFATYTNKKFNHKLIKVNDIQEYMKYSPLPSKGLTGPEMMEIFRSNGSPVDYHLMKKVKKRGISKKQVSLEEYSYFIALNHITNILDTYIESELPVILYKAKHVILIIGHTNDNPKKYIVYDDSGVFLKNVIGQNSFIGLASNKELFPKNNEKTYLICATHERVYLTAEEYNGFVRNQISQLNIEEDDIVKKRNIIVDNTELKAHLLSILRDASNLDDITREKILNLSYCDLPHYLWYTEVHLHNGSMIVLIGDATYPVNTNLNIFKLCFLVSSIYEIKLLTHIKK
ncbi:MAG: hypothetical protein NC311_08810 [Muribaculaceae bacterium]|nr:hypothetical protein [Muribaculaceae bacterium]MCM1399935.1 hypothetical protein [Clostridium sp.]MCM1460737.1 hypothetical protein [Bacteroides sp.]